MGGIKVDHTHEINEAHAEWLSAMTEKHGLPDEGKTLRIVLDFAMHECDDKALFGEVRCHHC